MRRSEREIKDFKKIISIISQCNCCRVGFYDAEKCEVYIVPMNFGFNVDENEKVFLYFHGAASGRKYSIIKEKPNVGFELDTNYKCVGHESACSYTAKYSSVVGNGVIEEVLTADEKEFGLELLMKQATGRDGWSFSRENVEGVCVFKLSVSSLSCKENV